MPTKTITEFPARVQLNKVRPDEAVLVPVTVKSGFIVKQGDVVGKITASGKYRRRARTTATGAGFATNSKTGHVTDASVFAVGDVLVDASGNPIGTIDAGGVDADANTVTLTANSSTAVASGVGVLASDGSAVAQGVSDKETDGADDTPVDVFIGGFFDEAKLRGVDASAKSELSGASVAGGVFKF